jgi:hypothetical protein
MLRVGLRSYSEQELEDKVTARMDRQSVLTRPTPPELWVILEEAVIRRPVGGDAVMREQLAHILRLAATPRIFVQVLPISRGARTGATASRSPTTFRASSASATARTWTALC